VNKTYFYLGYPVELIEVKDMLTCLNLWKNLVVMMMVIVSGLFGIGEAELGIVHF
jgi:hypothetical protein